MDLAAELLLEQLLPLINEATLTYYILKREPGIFLRKYAGFSFYLMFFTNIVNPDAQSDNTSSVFQ